jgi:hypothetical protein
MDWKNLLGSITESVDEELRLHNGLPSCRPRSRRRSPQLPLCEAKAPQHRRNRAFEDFAVMLSGHKWPIR